MRKRFRILAKKGGMRPWALGMLLMTMSSASGAFTIQYRMTESVPPPIGLLGVGLLALYGTRRRCCSS